MTLLEIDENKHLSFIMEKLVNSLEELSGSVKNKEADFIKSMKYLWENRNEMDKMEIFSNEMSAMRIVDMGENTLKQRNKILKLMESPYFARIDFKLEDESEAQAFYIGRFTYTQSGNMLIYDWRAPVSSIYYEFELGPAFYQAPAGKMDGELMRKRQYKIKNGLLEYALESETGVNDEVLQKELSHTSDKKMKNIIATIQKEQNRIIRNEHSQTLIIQGSAGSGKTSVALHRAAYFLYKYKDRLEAHNIMIISPNKVFADYISNVLPELGEEPLNETGFEEIAAEILGQSLMFESYTEQMEKILSGNDNKLSERIRFKSSLEFLTILDDYIAHAEENGFKPVDCSFGTAAVSKDYIENRYKALKSKPILKRIELIAEDILRKIKLENRWEEKLPGKKSILKKLRSMMAIDDTMALYTDFYHFIGRDDLFIRKKGGILEASDVYPYIYMKLHFEGIKLQGGVKHLLIDEMQDYTPVQYALINKLFPCPKTILGDMGQIVNPNNSLSLNTFLKLYKNAEYTVLTKSYRSTYEIIKFAQKIQKHSDIEAIERHGPEPEIIGCNTHFDEYNTVDKLLNKWKESGSPAVGILCKSGAQAKELYIKLKERHDVILLDSSSNKFSNGIIVTSIFMAKGLEFDEVIIPFANNENYSSENGGNLLYIACTRAMHRLTLTYHGERGFYTNLN